MKRKLFIIISVIMLIIILDVSILFGTSNKLISIAKDNEEYIGTEEINNNDLQQASGEKNTIKQIPVEGETIETFKNNTVLSYENVRDDETLLVYEQGLIPWEIYPRGEWDAEIASSREYPKFIERRGTLDEANISEEQAIEEAKDDATLEIWEKGTNEKNITLRDLINGFEITTPSHKIFDPNVPGNLRNVGGNKITLKADIELPHNVSRLQLMERANNNDIIEGEDIIQLLPLSVVWYENYEDDNMTVDGTDVAKTPTPTPLGRGAIIKNNTLAVFNVKEGEENHNLTPGEAYILAHKKNVDFDISKVQYALYLYRLKSDKNFIGANNATYEVSNGLKTEAEELESFLQKKEEILNNNNNIPILDLKKNGEIDEYKDGTAGIVAFREDGKDDGEFIVGPFSIDYARKIIKPEQGANSEMVDDIEGTIQMGAIINAKLYGIKEGLEGGKKVIDTNVEVMDWDFIYTDVTYNETDGTVTRNKLEKFSDNSINRSIYPMPGETFYIRIGNKQVDAITRIEFEYQAMGAEGKVSVLAGTYNEIEWKPQTKAFDRLYVGRVTRSIPTGNIGPRRIC